MGDKFDGVIGAWWQNCSKVKGDKTFFSVEEINGGRMAGGLNVVTLKNGCGIFFSTGW